MAQEYIAYLTDIGLKKSVNAPVSGKKVNITHFAVGDGGGSYYTPAPGMTALKGEKWRGPVDSYSVNEGSPNMIDIKGIVPADVGGWTIREMGVFDDEGDMIGIMNTPDTAKVIVSSGAIGQVSILMKLAAEHADSFEMIIDPNVITATKQDVEDGLEAHNTNPNAHEDLLKAKADLVNGTVPKSQLPAMDYTNDFVSKSGDTMTGVLMISSGGLIVGETVHAAELGTCSVAEGLNTTASGAYSHAEGLNTTASGAYSHAEGHSNTASGKHSHAEGNFATASSDCSRAEGYGTTASGVSSHAEGVNTTASGNHSHAEGTSTTASGVSSRAEGYGTTASGYVAHAEGFGTTAAIYAEHAQGQYNVLSTGSATSWSAAGNAFVIGNGTKDTARSNSFRTTNDGKVYALSAFNSSGADYGEYCEWADGNPEQEERLGYFVTWDGDRVRIATDQDDYILGISTVNSAVIGNSDVSTWNGMYKADLWGRHETETVVTKAGSVICHDAVEDSEGNVIREAWDETVEEDQTETHFVLNPDYDSSQPYVNRENRPEWVDVGMLGRLWVRDDGTCEVNGYCRPDKNGCATKCDTGYRVLKRQDGFAWVMFR